MKQRVKQKFWTRAQVRVLRKLYPNTPTRRIACKLRREISQVRSKAALLGLKKSARFLAGPDSGRRLKGCAPTNGKAWTRRDVARLHELYPDWPSAVVALALDRSVPQVSAKAQAFGLKKTQRRARLSGGEVRAIARAYDGTLQSRERLARRYKLASPKQVLMVVRRVDGRKARRSRRHFNAAEDRKIRDLYPSMLTSSLAKRLKRKVASVHRRAAELGISKSAEYMARQHQAEARRLTAAGVAHRFKKGLVPPNKGKKMPGYAPGRMAETQFKKGQRARNWMPIGAERMAYGYRLVKMADVPHQPYFRNWYPVHVLNWEIANRRQMPAGHCLWFKDRDRTNCDPSNLELITRAENIRRNFHNYPPALKEVMKLQGRLNRAIKRRSQDEEQDRRST